ncbi:MAG TPA: CmpA/NrtA family ABC transporter substrate-binding protein [Pirellulales bacterium]|nr:CmpA/NrtA family ABC transporter substrate-binding protein [Pirellulales bacterium]
MNRRNFLQSLGTASLLLGAGCREERRSPGIGSRRPIRIGILATTDMAPIVMADKLGLFKKHGLDDVTLTKESSWSNIRDKLLIGELDLGQILFGVPFLVYSSDDSAGRVIRIALTLNVNNQTLTLAKELAPQIGYGRTDGVKGAIEDIRGRNSSRPPTFGQSLNGSLPDMLLRCWLAASQVDPATVHIISVPPPQAVAKMKVGELDGFFTAEPWHDVAIREHVGFTHYASQDMWQDGPDKCLAVNAKFADERRDDVKRVTKAVLEASRWLDEPANRIEAASVISDRAYVNLPADLILPRFEVEARFNLGGGLGEKRFPPLGALAFHKGGKASFPYRSHGLWFMAQYVRFGLVKNAPDYLAAADAILMQDLYREVAGELDVSVPNDDMTPFACQIDGVTFDPNDVAASIARYA